MNEEEKIELGDVAAAAVKGFEDGGYAALGWGYCAQTARSTDEIYTVIVACGPHAVALGKWLESPDAAPPLPKRSP